MAEMKSKAALTLFWLLVGAGCKSSSGPPTSPSPVQDRTEVHLGKLFFHDLTVGDQYDIFMADLVVVTGQGSSPAGIPIGISAGDFAGAPPRRGVRKIPRAEIDGRTLEGPVLYGDAPFDAVLPDSAFVLKNLENVTMTSVADEYDPAISPGGVLAYVQDPDGRYQISDNTDIVIMDLADRLPRRITPINGQYVGENWDPEWKDEGTIVWVHRDRVIQASLADLGGAAELLPAWRWPQFDPLYSPDRTKLLFNSWVRSKKNSYWKNMGTGVTKSILPSTVFNACTDDNPVWVFSNTLITGHAFMPKKGRVYTRDIERDTFVFITDGTRDFRYVTPVAMPDAVRFVFSDYADPNRPRLWTCGPGGEGLRPMRLAGDEALFAQLGYAAPGSADELDSAARLYVSKFTR